MKKTYIFMNIRLYGIDGSMQYVYNKSKFLEANGYDVIVFTCKSGRILIKDFEKYLPYNIPEMRYCPSMLNKCERKRILKRIVNAITSFGGDLITIESNAPDCAVWGELAARIIGCKHVIFYLLERTDFSKDFRDYFRFKYEQHELAGITEETVPRLLDDNKVKPVHITAYCGNVFADVRDDFSNRLNPNAQWTLGTIGRLDKSCMPIIAEHLSHYFDTHKEIEFNYIIIGGDAQGAAAKELSSIFENCSNVSFLITDYLYPIPNDLIRNIDLFVSASGSATATYRLCRPTIQVDPISGATLGIIGYDFRLGEKDTYETSNDCKIEESIERILKFNTNIIFEELVGDDYNIRMEHEFERQILMTQDSVPRNYYNTNLLYAIKTPFISHHDTQRIICKMIGARNLMRIVKNVKKIAGINDESN